MLHFTNGDIAAEKLRQAQVPGEVVAWRDVLHEGPVPAGLDLAELRPVRARFIAERGWGEYAEVLEDLARRDAMLVAASEHEEVVLWFEPDLYDQLQLLQLIDHFAAHPPRGLSLLCLDAVPGEARFRGFGQMRPEQLSELLDLRRTVSEAQLELGREAWAAFRSSTPESLQELLTRDTSALPFLRDAMQRHLAQYPSVFNGLSCTERQVLALVASGIHTPQRLFQAQQELEAMPFLGDTVFWSYLNELLTGDEPLLRRADHAEPLREPVSGGTEPVLVMTERGEAVREGREDAVLVRGGIDRWYGGVHLQGPDADWRWDAEQETIRERR